MLGNIPKWTLYLFTICIWFAILKSVYDIPGDIPGDTDNDTQFTLVGQEINFPRCCLSTPHVITAHTHVDIHPVAEDFIPLAPLSSLSSQDFVAKHKEGAILWQWPSGGSAGTQAMAQKP